MRGTMTNRQYGVDGARRHLPELLDRAHRGENIVITKHGKPYAALVEATAAKRLRGAFSRLRGTGKGLWGRDAAKAIDKMRREW
jgi:prevent-host-death family protein